MNKDVHLFFESVPAICMADSFQNVVATTRSQSTSSYLQSSWATVSSSGLHAKDKKCGLFNITECTAAEA